MGNVQKINRLHRTQYSKFTYVSIILWFVVFLFAYINHFMLLFGVLLAYMWLNLSFLRTVNKNKSLNFLMFMPIRKRDLFASIAWQFYVYNTLFLILAFVAMLMNPETYFNYLFEMNALLITLFYGTCLICFAVYILFSAQILSLKKEIHRKLATIAIELVVIAIIFAPTVIFFDDSHIWNNIARTLKYMAIAIPLYCILYYIIYRISFNRKIPLQILGDS